MHYDFLIADHVVRVEDATLAAHLTGFECNSESTSALGPCDQGPICSVTRSSDPAQHGVERMDPAFPIHHVLTLTRHKSAVLLADDGFERAMARSCTAEGYADLLLLAVYSRLTYYRTVFVHGALIESPNVGGVMFVGRSGVGKTTQAELWQTYGDARVINGDKVFLSVKDECPDTIFAYGCPWNGSSPYRENRRVPLKAIIDLKRDPEHHIRRLDDLEALITYMPSVFMPNWDTRLTEKVMDTLDLMMPRVPIYRMSCGLDRSGMDLVRGVLENL